jgi:hypothetical protein
MAAVEAARETAEPRSATVAPRETTLRALKATTSAFCFVVTDKGSGGIDS